MIYKRSQEINNVGNYPKIRVFSVALGIALNWSVSCLLALWLSDWAHFNELRWNTPIELWMPQLAVKDYNIPYLLLN